MLGQQVPKHKHKFKDFYFPKPTIKQQPKLIIDNTKQLNVNNTTSSNFTKDDLTKDVLTKDALTKNILVIRHLHYKPNEIKLLHYKPSDKDYDTFCYLGHKLVDNY